MIRPPAARTAVPVRTFRQQSSSTRRGARLARRLAVRQLDLWGVPYGSDASDTAALLVAELAGNAVRHGHVPGRDFALRLSLAGAVLRIEVDDPRGEREPVPRSGVPDDAECGRGLLLVDALAAAWGTRPRLGPGKTVWAELAVGLP